jgi:hypothetical protein
LYKGFSIENGIRKATLNIVGRSQIRLGREETVIMQCKNSGNIDMDSVLIRIFTPVNTVCKSVNGDTLLVPRNGRKPGAPIYFWVDKIRIGETVQLSVVVSAPVNIIRMQKVAAAKEFEVSVLVEGEVVEITNGVLQDMVDKIYQEVIVNGRQNVNKSEIMDYVKSKLAEHVGMALLEHVIGGAILLFCPVCEMPLLVWDVLNAANDFGEMAGKVFELWIYQQLSLVTSCDPNDKSGPSGFSAAGYTTFDHPFTYNIYFENVDSATVPAEEIWIRDTLDPHLNWNSLVFDTSSHKPTSITFDSTKGAITWYFRDINLPPNKTPPQGEGWVRYHIDPKPKLPHMAQICNRAWITFDANKPIATRTVLNTNDTLMPSSAVALLDSIQSDTAFTIKWTGVDSGAGIRTYSIYVSENDSPYVHWLTTDTTAAVFKAGNGKKYKFYCISTDNAGNMEIKEAKAEAATMVNAAGVIGLMMSKLPKAFGLMPNYPNPFRNTTRIQFAIPPALKDQKRHVEIQIFNISGKLVRTLVNGDLSAGYHTVSFDGKNYRGKALGTGLYLCRMKAENFTKTIVLSLIR